MSFHLVFTTGIQGGNIDTTSRIQIKQCNPLTKCKAGETQQQLHLVVHCEYYHNHMIRYQLRMRVVIRLAGFLLDRKANRG